MKSIGSSHLQNRTETSNTKSVENLKDRLASAEKTLKFLEAISPRAWTDAEQRTLYRSALAAHPDWKLQELISGYRGPVNHRVFEYLGALQQAPRSTQYNDKQIANYSDPERGRYFMKLTRELLYMGMPKDALQQALYWLMKVEYPDWEP